MNAKERGDQVYARLLEEFLSAPPDSRPKEIVVLYVDYCDLCYCEFVPFRSLYDNKRTIFGVPLVIKEEREREMKEQARQQSRRRTEYDESWVDKHPVNRAFERDVAELLQRSGQPREIAEAAMVYERLCRAGLVE